MIPAPIVLFVYNRPLHTAKTLYALAENDGAQDSVLYIYADGAKENASEETKKNIEETRRIIREKKWCKEVYIIESTQNKGLAASVIDGITEVVNKHGRIIVLEDDLITARGFLKFMNEGLNTYANSIQVQQVSGYNFPVTSIPKNQSSFFLPMITSWGWGTWKRVWDNFDEKASGYELLKSDKKLEEQFNLDNSYLYSRMLFKQMEEKSIDSWAIRFWWSVFKGKGISLFPDRSLVRNIGFGSEGTHTTKDNYFSVEDFDMNYFINNYSEKAYIHEKNYEAIKFFLRQAFTVGPEKEKKQTFIQRIKHKLFNT